MRMDQIQLLLEPYEDALCSFSFVLSEDFRLVVKIEQYNKEQNDFVFLSYYLERHDWEGDICKAKYITSEYSPDLTYAEVLQRDRDDLLSELKEYVYDFVYSENGLRLEDFDHLLEWHEFIEIDPDGEMTIGTILPDHSEGEPEEE